MTNADKRDLLQYLIDNPDADNKDTACFFSCAVSTVRAYKKTADYRRKQREEPTV